MFVFNGSLREGGLRLFQLVEDVNDARTVYSSLTRHFYSLYFLLHGF